LIETFLTCFLQTVVYQPPWYEKVCESMTVESVGKLVSGLLNFIPVDNTFIVSSKVRVKVELPPDIEIKYIFFILDIVKDKVTQGVYAASIMTAIQKCLNHLPPLVAKLGTSDASSDLTACIGMY